MKNTKQAIALASAAALSVGMLAGCGEVCSRREAFVIAGSGQSPSGHR